MFLSRYQKFGSNLWIMRYDKTIFCRDHRLSLMKSWLSRKNHFKISTSRQHLQRNASSSKTTISTILSRYQNKINTSRPGPHIWNIFGVENLNQAILNVFAKNQNDTCFSSSVIVIKTLKNVSYPKTRRLDNAHMSILWFVHVNIHVISIIESNGVEH